MADPYREYKKILPAALLAEVKDELPSNASDTRIKKVLAKVAEEYEVAQVSAGESVGLVSAESIGEPGTQMSLDSDEEVVVKQGDQVRTVKIGTFVDRIMKNKECRKFNHTEVCDVEDLDFFVPALGITEKVEWKKITALSRHTSPEKLLKLTTRSGRSIIATPYHSFVVRQNNKVVPVAGSTLVVGDRIPVVKNVVNQTNNQFLALQKYLPKTEYVYESELQKALDKQPSILPVRSYEQINNYAQGRNKLQLTQNCVYCYQNHSTAMIPETVQLDYLFGFFVGAYLAEGTHTPYCVAITNTSAVYLDTIKRFAEKYKIGYNLRYELGEYGKSVSIVINSKLIADLLLRTCGKKAAGKRIPNFAFAANKRFAQGLLRAYFDGDANVNVARRVIRASSSSNALLQGIASLLTRFSIFSVRGRGKQYTLSISYKYAAAYFRNVGFGIPRKQAALRELIELKPDKRYDLIEMIPNFGKIISDTGKKLNIPSRLTNKFTKKQKIGRSTLKKYLSLFEEKANVLGVNIDYERLLMRRMINADVVWDEIVAMEYVTPSSANVYDFSVDDVETFTTFDGIITHNTLNTFHYAGVSEMNITVGLPRIIEILDGRVNISTPMMEIYLKSPYNKGKDIKQVAHLLRETKLRHLAKDIVINIVEQAIEIELNPARLEDAALTAAQVFKIMEKSVRGVKSLILKRGKETIFVTLKQKEDSINALYKVKEKLKEFVVSGVKGVTQVLPVKKDDEYVIITAGSNLPTVLNLDFVDHTRTRTNDILEIAQVLGIEAARAAIVNEVINVIETQGLNVDIRHIMLVADTMCLGGKVKGITRYGIVGEKASVLARASFETPIRHIIQASMVGEEDKLDSVVENVMLNQPVPVGTGLPGLVTKVKKPE